jgi:hypothetical protein
MRLMAFPQAMTLQRLGYYAVARTIARLSGPASSDLMILPALILIAAGRKTN